jgi:hypothetical protein
LFSFDPPVGHVVRRLVGHESIEAQLF